MAPRQVHGLRVDRLIASTRVVRLVASTRASSTILRRNAESVLEKIDLTALQPRDSLGRADLLDSQEPWG
jgi:hypothetical protein